MSRVCEYCGKALLTQRSIARFCSSNCRKYAFGQAARAPRTPGYRAWQGMRGRVLNPADKNYNSYGGRGITIDPAWDSFAVFLADMGPRPQDRTLDRINNDGPYSKGNCRWATRGPSRHIIRGKRNWTPRAFDKLGSFGKAPISRGKN